MIRVTIAKQIKLDLLQENRKVRWDFQRFKAVKQAAFGIQSIKYSNLPTLALDSPSYHNICFFSAAFTTKTAGDTIKLIV
jgi:hypothetical protein